MRPALRRAAGVALGLSLIVVPSASAQALPAGSFDPAFGNGGQVDLGFDGTIGDLAMYRTGPESGNLVATGYSGDTVGPFIARFTSDGAFDQSFSGDGIADGIANDVSDVQALNDGGVLVTSTDQIEHYRSDGAYLNTIELAGVADIHFDQTGADAGTILYARSVGTSAPTLRVGRTSLNGDPIWERALNLKENPTASEAGWTDDGWDGFHVTQTPDGRVLAAGTHRLDISIFRSIRKFGAVRLTAGGQLDSSFGVGGGVAHQIGGDQDFHIVADVAVGQSGRVLLSGAATATSAGLRRPVVVRLTAGGAVDSSFAGDGVAFPLAGVGGNGAFYDVREDSKGRILAGGIVEAHDTAAYDAGVVRLLDDGSNDPDFGDSGLASIAPTTYPAGNMAFGLEVEDGGIVIGGQFSHHPGAPDRRAALARFLAERTSDEGGGDGGGVAGDVAASGRGLRIHKFVSPRTLEAIAARGMRAQVSCTLACRAVLKVKVPLRTAQEMGLRTRVIARGSRTTGADRRRWMVLRLTPQARPALRAHTGRISFKLTGRGLAP
jgi:uncharacterized delta-60 repeat protein